MKKPLTLLFSDNAITEFMQKCSIFSNDKFLVKQIITGTASAEFGMNEVSKIIDQCQLHGKYTLVAAVCGNFSWFNARVKTISDGTVECTPEAYLGVKRNVEHPPNTSVGSPQRRS